MSERSGKRQRRRNERGNVRLEGLNKSERKRKWKRSEERERME